MSRLSAPRSRPAAKKILALWALLSLAACSRDSAPEKAPEGPPPVKVEAVTLEARPFAERTWLPAEVRPQEEVRLSAEAMGRITWMCCEENEAVEAGQVVARIDPAVNLAQVAQARTGLEQAERDRARAEPLVQRGAVTRAQLEDARAREATARAAYAQAVAASRKTTLRSPIDGRIAKRWMHAGEIASPAQPVFDLVDISAVKVVAGLPERDFASLEQGATVDVRIDAYPGEAFEGRVTRVGLVAGKARTFPVEVTVANPQARLRPGMVGEVRLTGRSYDHVVAIPQDAVIDELQSRRVYVVGRDAGIAEERTVTLGPRDGDRVVVTGGLAPGDRLIVTGHRFLTDGRPIELVRAGRLDDAGRPVFDSPQEALGAQARPRPKKG